MEFWPKRQQVLTVFKTWYFSIPILGSSSLSCQVMLSLVAPRAIILGGRTLFWGLLSSTPTIGSSLNSSEDSLSPRAGNTT